MRTTSSDPPRTALDRLVRQRLGVSWGKARAWIRAGKILVGGIPLDDPLAVVDAGADVVLREDAPRTSRGGVLPPDAIVHLDDHLVVVDKPPGVSTVPYERGERGTLDEMVRVALSRRLRRARGFLQGRPPLGVVHRLDKETSGLIAFTRTWLAKKGLSEQFRAHTVHRRYLALAHGLVRSGTISSRLVPDRGDGLRGSIEAMPRRRRAAAAGAARPAVTHVEAIETLGGATLVACRLATGRTHQVRIHLSEAGHPLVGERVYIRGLPGNPIPAPRVMLHAAELGFLHPADGRPVRWELGMPADMRRIAEAIRRSS